MTFVASGKRPLALAVLIALTASLPATSQATPATRSVERFDVKVANAGMNAGAARVRADAPTHMVRSVVTDYARYSKIITSFKQARVVGRSGESTDVYLEVPILNGAGKIWAVVRFAPPEVRDDGEIIRGRLIKGNVKRLDATWRIQKIDEKASEIRLDLLIVPDLPAPKSLVTGELRKAAGKAVNMARNEAEQRTSRAAR